MNHERSIANRCQGLLKRMHSRGGLARLEGALGVHAVYLLLLSSCVFRLGLDVNRITLEFTVLVSVVSLTTVLFSMPLWVLAVCLRVPTELRVAVRSLMKFGLLSAIASALLVAVLCYRMPGLLPSLL